jgi:hypothetical protein
MSSLLQFGGKVDPRKGVGLVFALEEEGASAYDCLDCGRRHERLYEAFRKPVGMFGHWVVFRYNGAEHVPDLSIPITVAELPRGARAMTNEECSKYWHS